MLTSGHKVLDDDAVSLTNPVSSILCLTMKHQFKKATYCAPVGTGTKFLITKFLIIKFLITKFLITKFLITKFLIKKFLSNKVSK